MALPRPPQEVGTMNRAPISVRPAAKGGQLGRHAVPTLPHSGVGGGNIGEPRETGDRRIGWGHIFRSRVSAIGYLVRVFRFGCRFGKSAICHPSSIQPSIQPSTQSSIQSSLIDSAILGQHAVLPLPKACTPSILDTLSLRSHLTPRPLSP